MRDFAQPSRSHRPWFHSSLPLRDKPLALCGPQPHTRKTPRFCHGQRGQQQDDGINRMAVTKVRVRHIIQTRKNHRKRGQRPHKLPGHSCLPLSSVLLLPCAAFENSASLRYLFPSSHNATTPNNAPTAVKKLDKRIPRIKLESVSLKFFTGDSVPIQKLQTSSPPAAIPIPDAPT